MHEDLAFIDDKKLSSLFPVFGTNCGPRNIDKMFQEKLGNWRVMNGEINQVWPPTLLLLMCSTKY